jgi:hypothetical protein
MQFIYRRPLCQRFGIHPHRAKYRQRTAMFCTARLDNKKYYERRQLLTSLSEFLERGVASAERDIELLNSEREHIKRWVQVFMDELPGGFFENLGCRLEVVQDGLQLLSQQTGEPCAKCLFDTRSLQFNFEFPIGETKYPLPPNDKNYPVLAGYLSIAAAKQGAYLSSNCDERFWPTLTLERATLEH